MKRLPRDSSRLHWDVPHGPGSVLVRVAVQPYRRFDGWIDRQLERLVERWARPAVPAVERAETFAAAYKPK